MARFDAEGYERKRRPGGRVQCGCGRYVTLWEETETWVRRRDGRWRHKEYGPAQGTCTDCHLAYIDYFEACFVLDLSQSEDVLEDAT